MKVATRSLAVGCIALFFVSYCSGCQMQTTQASAQSRSVPSTIESVPTPLSVTAIAPTQRPLMSSATVAAKRALYEKKYGKSRGQKFSGSRTETAFDCSASQPEDYAGWLSLALKHHRHIRLFKIKASCSIPMATFEDVWVYDRQLGLLTYFQRVFSIKPHKVSGYRVYKNVDDSAIHVLAEDNRTLNFIDNFIARSK